MIGAPMTNIWHDKSEVVLSFLSTVCLGRRVLWAINRSDAIIANSYLVVGVYTNLLRSNYQVVESLKTSQRAT
jgi:hypothetical protein